VYGSERDALEHAEQLLQEGKRQEARQLLVTYIRRAPDSAQAWWLLSQVVLGEKQQMDCLERVLRLDPGHAPAQFRLEKLKRGQERPFSPPPPSPEFHPPGAEPVITGPANKPAPAFSPGTPANDSRPTFEPKREPSSGPAELTLPPPAAREKRPPAGKKKAGFLQIALMAVGLCIGVAGTGYVGMLVLRQKMAMDTQATQVMAQAWTRNPPMTLPPTWTPTTTLTPLPSKTPTLTSTPTPLPRIVGPVVGLYAPDFSLKNVPGGTQVRLSSYEGQPILLVFWATWCPYCEREMSVLNSVYKTYKDGGLVLLGINTGDSDSKVRSYRDAHNLVFTVLLDSQRTVMRRYQVSSIPFHFFIDADGKIRYAASGFMEKAAIDDMVKVIMAERGTP
jgi:peroxiredoxin